MSPFELAQYLKQSKEKEEEGRELFGVEMECFTGQGAA
jgi:hypothetical protein